MHSVCIICQISGKEDCGRESDFDRQDIREVGRGGAAVTRGTSPAANRARRHSLHTERRRVPGHSVSVKCGSYRR